MVGSFFLLVLWPKQCELTALGEAVERERGLVNQKVATSQEGVYVSARIPSLRRAQDLCLRRLPPEPRVAEFLRAVAECVAAEPAVTQEIQRADSQAVSASPPAVPVALRLTGPVDGVCRCLAAIEGMERLNRVRTARLANGSVVGQVVADVELLVYYLPAEEAKTVTHGPTGKAQAEAVKG